MNIKATVTEADQTFTELMQVLSTVPEQNINKIPFTGSWTAGQNVQHIILSAGAFVQLMNGPMIDTERDPEQNVNGLRSIFLNFDVKMQSPDFILPEQRDYDKGDLIKTIGHIRKVC